MRTIQLKLNENGRWIYLTDKNVIGVTYEHMATTIEVIIPEAFRDFEHSIEIKLPDESSYLVDDLDSFDDIEGIRISFPVTEEMLRTSGRCYLQYVGRTVDSTLYKSDSMCELFIQKGINAHTPLDEEERKDIVELIRRIAGEIINELLGIEDEWVLLDGGLFGETFENTVDGGLFSETAIQEIDGGIF